MRLHCPFDRRDEYTEFLFNGVEEFIEREGREGQAWGCVIIDIFLRTVVVVDGISRSSLVTCRPSVIAVARSALAAH